MHDFHELSAAEIDEVCGGSRLKKLWDAAGYIVGVLELKELFESASDAMGGGTEGAWATAKIGNP